MPDDPLFGSERAMLADLKIGVGYLLRKYADARREIRALKEELGTLKGDVKQKEARVSDLEARLAFGTAKGVGEEGSKAVLKIRDEVDDLIYEVDRCLKTLEKSIK